MKEIVISKIKIIPDEKGRTFICQDLDGNNLFDGKKFVLSSSNLLKSSVDGKHLLCRTYGYEHYLVDCEKKEIIAKIQSFDVIWLGGYERIIITDLNGMNLRIEDFNGNVIYKASRYARTPFYNKFQNGFLNLEIEFRKWNYVDINGRILLKENVYFAMPFNEKGIGFIKTSSSASADNKKIVDANGKIWSIEEWKEEENFKKSLKGLLR